MPMTYIHLPLTLQATRPDPHELIQLHHMVYSDDPTARANECTASDNLIVRTVAEHIESRYGVRYLRPK